MSGEIPVRCPLTNEPVREFIPCAATELDPLLTWLGTRQPETNRQVFPRGIVENGRLDLCKQALGPAGAERVLKALDGNPTIRSVLLGTNGLRDEGANIVAEAMRRNPDLETIYLGCNGITATGLNALCASIEQDGCGTRALWLKRNPLGRPGAERLEQLLRRPHPLRILDLVNTGLGDEGACRIMGAIIQSPQHLERIYLGGNSLTLASAAVAGKMIAQCQKISAIYLGANFLYDDGAEIIAPSFRLNWKLRELSLASNGLTNRGLSAICRALDSHPTVEFLDLGTSPSARILGAPPNAIDSTETIHPLATLIASLTNLRRLNLRGNLLTASAAHQILDACERRHIPCVVDLACNPCGRRPRKRAAALAEKAMPRNHSADLDAIRSAAR